MSSYRVALCQMHKAHGCNTKLLNSEFHYSDNCYAECYYAECLKPECHYAKCLKAACHYAEFLNSEL